MAGAMLPLLLFYSFRAHLSGDMRLFLFAFAASGALYAASLDWAAWGQERFRLLGWAKAIVPLCILLLILPGRPAADLVLWRAAAGNACGLLLQSAVFWIWWRKRQPLAANDYAREEVGESLAWGRVSVMGMAWLCNLAFNTIDMLMLGWMSSPREVGLYTAGYRVLNQVLATYYLMTQVLYPQFAQQGREERAHMLRAGIWLPLAGAGIAIAVLVSLFRRTILTVLFGHEFLAAGSLLVLLSWSIPLDFLTSYLSNAFIAWGMEKRVLVCTVIAAAGNIALNRWLIPGFGARAAAANTVISYIILLVSLWLAGRTAEELGLRGESRLALSRSRPKNLRYSQN
jgi:O-antigen/teichoic acid export membrane protein